MHRCLIAALLPACLMAAGYTPAQVILDRQVISPFAIAGTLNDSIRINVTLGQVEYLTIADNDHYLTQGFHQPQGSLDPFVEFTVSQDSCSGIFTIQVTALQNCDETGNINYWWNGSPGADTFETLDTSVDLFVQSEACVAATTIVPAAEPVSVTPCALGFYTIITPNGDGVNDAWYIENLYGPWLDNKVAIFNRWGAEVWKGNNYDNTEVVWRGNAADGTALPDGTYYFTLECEVNNQSGYIELQR